MSKFFSAIVPSAYEDERVDTIVLELLEEEELLPEDFTLSRSKVVRWIEQGNLKINGAVVTKNGTKLLGGESLELEIPEATITALEPDATVPFTVVHEDACLLVVDKPAGVVTHPGAGIQSGTLVQGVLAHLGSDVLRVGDALRPGLVHRLDKDTSGLLVLAKDERSYQHLLAQFHAPRTIHREYLAFCYAAPRGGERAGTIDAKIGRDETHRVRMSVRTNGGRESVTHWEIEESLPFGVLLRVKLETGRTHQIRVHLESVGAPIIGDQLYRKYQRDVPKLYQSAVQGMVRQALHATQLSFIHPATGDMVDFHSALPPDLRNLHQALLGVS